MLEVQNASYTYTSKYQTNEVLHDVYCTFEQGKMYAIIGPSGSGKTTLLSLLAGLDLPTKGEIMLDGKSMTAMDRDTYRRDTASVIYQSFNLFPLLTALENVMFPLQLQGKPMAEAKAEAMKCIESVNLKESVLNHRPQRMSGGEQQRVAIARALAAGGRILLADEPTGNLDAANGEAVVAILKKLAHEKDYIVVVITHNTSIAEQTDVVYRIVDGRLSTGTAE